MKFEGWQANTTEEDVAASLRRYGAEDIRTVADEQWPAWKWTSYVDTDEDIVDTLSIMLWYNDRSDEDISTIRDAMTKILKKYPRK